ncbi:MAG: SemiSWEET transporter [Candidatus Omnitrophica bacterium]|nr:SemiSWEET transporter [Candidatus Omnitrophota bacterium]
MNTMFWKTIGICAATLTTFSFVPQIIKIIQTKSSKDLSLITLLQFALGVFLWMIYGIHIKDIIIITANTVTLVTIITLISLYFVYKKP